MRSVIFLFYLQINADSALIHFYQNGWTKKRKEVKKR